MTVYIIYNNVLDRMVNTYNTKKDALNYINSLYRGNRRIFNIEKYEEGLKIYGITNDNEDSKNMDYFIIRKKIKFR